MSASPKFMIEVRDLKTNKWHKLNLKCEINGNVIESEVYPWNGNHDLFHYLKSDGGFEPDNACTGIHYGLPIDVSDGVKKVYDKWFSDNTHSPEPAKYVYLSDLMYSIKCNPNVKDYDADWGEDDKDPKYKDNPLIEIKNIIFKWVEFSEFFFEIEEHMSDIRLVYWVV